MTQTMRLLGVTGVAILLAACATGAPPQSPHEVDSTAPTTSDGEVIGADREQPAKKLDESPKVDSQQGVKPAATPASD
jgi:hypothetical protein